MLRALRVENLEARRPLRTLGCGAVTRAARQQIQRSNGEGMTYKDIQRKAATILGVRPSSVKTCWIAEAKRELGLTCGVAPNTGHGQGAPPCPPGYKDVIKRILSR